MATGSSPLTRGKRYSVHRLTCACGFIPAHAGKTSHDPAHQSASTAHPRSRRENDLTEPIMELMPGSSPLTRGKLDRAAGPGQVVGLIPAHAGKTSCSVEPLGSVGAHPRSRGENGGTRSLRIPARGSSPLTRGKQAVIVTPEPTNGLIPAHAGKTYSARQARTRPRAHPRSRGENRRHARQDTHDLGSSPLTRGKHQLHESCCFFPRLIPAHAGKTNALKGPRP